MRGSLSKVLTAVALASAVLSAPLLSSAGASAVGARPTLAQLESEIAQSAKIKASPSLNTLVPKLQSMSEADVTMIPMPSECYGSWPPSAPQPVPTNAATACAWGDRAAKRSIFLFGDSQAAMWLPAFNALGKDLGWKVLFLAKKSCSPWITSSRSNYGDGTSVLSNSACQTFVKNAIGFAKSVHPTIVIPLGLALLVASEKTVTSSDEKTAVLKTVKALRASGAKILFLAGMSSMFSGVTPQQCLTVHVSDLPACEVTVSEIKTYVQYSGLVSAAALAKVDVVPTLKLFCAKKVCPIVVRAGSVEHLVYFDLGHMNNTYSAWISGALETLMKPYLVTG